MQQTVKQLATAIHTLIDQGVDGDPATFPELALRVFGYQYRANTPYRQYCDGYGITPATIHHWQQIPAFPTSAFKDGLVTSFPLEQAVMAQLTSGTTANRRGEIYRDAIGRELVFHANRVMTGAFLFPDLELQPRCRVLILAPSPQMAPSMGMAMGMEETRLRFGAPNSRFLLTHSGIDIKGLIDDLGQAEQSGQPVAFIGATGAFVYFFKACQKRGISFQLPPGSRIGDGGGYRGRFGKVERADYYQMAEQILGIDADHCVNVLGMAESATNFFENSLRRTTKGGDGVERFLVSPSWTRTVVVDPHTLQPLADGEVGLLRHYDLANLPTVLAVQSDNLGISLGEQQFSIIGRAQIDKGRVSMVPAERTVGPMGDNRIFRFLEHYVNFSIRFKMGRIAARTPMVPATTSMGSACPCGEGIEEMVAQDNEPL